MVVDAFGHLTFIPSGTLSPNITISGNGPKKYKRQSTLTFKLAHC